MTVVADNVSGFFLLTLEKPFIDFDDHKWVKVLGVNASAQNIKIPVKFDAYPEPTVRWYVDHVQ